jgi:hypothetical protein
MNPRENLAATEPSWEFFMPEFPAELLTTYLVTPKMNRVSFNDPEAIAPLNSR